MWFGLHLLWGKSVCMGSYHRAPPFPLPLSIGPLPQTTVQAPKQ